MVVSPGRLSESVLLTEVLSAVELLVPRAVTSIGRRTLSLLVSPNGDLKYDGADMVSGRCVVADSVIM